MPDRRSLREPTAARAEPGGGPEICDLCARPSDEDNLLARVDVAANVDDLALVTGPWPRRPPYATSEAN